MSDMAQTDEVRLDLTSNSPQSNLPGEFVLQSKLLGLANIFFILVTFLFYSRVIL